MFCQLFNTRNQGGFDWLLSYISCRNCCLSSVHRHHQEQHVLPCITLFHFVFHLYHQRVNRHVNGNMNSVQRNTTVVLSMLTYPLITTVPIQGLEDVTNQLIKAKMSSLKQEKSHSPPGREQHIQQLHQKVNTVTDNLYRRHV